MRITKKESKYYQVVDSLWRSVVMKSLTKENKINYTDK